MIKSGNRQNTFFEYTLNEVNFIILICTYKRCFNIHVRKTRLKKKVRENIITIPNLKNEKLTIRDLSRGEIESLFGHFTKVNIRKMDSSQNSIWEKRTRHKVQYEENGLFTKFNMRKTDSSKNSLWERWILYKIKYRPCLRFSEAATPTPHFF